MGKNQGKIKVLNLKTSQPSKPYDFLIDRTTPLGNPFYINTERNRKQSIKLYKKYFKALLDDFKTKKEPNEESKQLCYCLWKIENVYKKHKKIRLFCHCAPLPCHGKIIKKYLQRNE